MTEFETNLLKQLQIMNELKAVELTLLAENMFMKGTYERAFKNIGKYKEYTPQTLTPNIQRP